MKGQNYLRVKQHFDDMVSTGTKVIYSVKNQIRYTIFKGFLGLTKLLKNSILEVQKCLKLRFGTSGNLTCIKTNILASQNSQ